ncbi:MAG: gliding motility-associated C-terminal domain-containing protein [Flavobacteriales bacterium]|nr:gliding motility-associated C-terminal domain-containing protein [Flavobacteriales bacterium]
MRTPGTRHLMRSLGVAFAFLLLSFASRASHVSGVDISFDCVGPNQYQITVNLFRDCSGISMPSTISVNVSSPCASAFNVTLQQVPGSGYEISQLCLPDLPNSDCNGGGLPGMQAYSYSALVTLNPPCNSWTVSWSTCCRNPTVNVPTSTADDIYAAATLNTLGAPCNDSPIFTAQPIPFVCVNQPVTYSYGVYDPDGDSLVFALVPGQQTATTFLTYGAGYSGTQPIPGITIDPNTGVVNFTPTVTGNYIVVVSVTEYDSNGNVIGTVMRDMQFTVISCTNIVPDAPLTMTNFGGSAVQTGPFSVEMCVGNQFCLDLVFTDQNVGDTLTLTSNVTAALPGSTFLQTGVNPATATICWTAVPGTSPVTTFVVFAEDDACPVTGITQQTVQITFLPRTLTRPDTVLCNAASVNLPVAGGSQFYWSVLSGDPIQLGVNFSCNPCNDPLATPAVTTTYMVESDLTGACINSDTVTVYVIDPFWIQSATPQNAVCNGQANGTVAVLAGGTAGPPWTWTASMGGTTYASTTTVLGPGSLTGLPAGTYTITLSEPLGCEQTTSVTIGEPPPMTVVASDTTICLSTNAVISAVPGGGNGGHVLNWSGGLVGNGPHTVSPGTTTNYTVTAVDALGCTSPADNATVTVHPPLNVSITGPDSICISAATQLTANPGGGNGGPYNFVWWQIGGGFMGTNNPVSVNPNTATVWYRVTVTDNCGSPPALDSLQLNWYPAPKPRFVADPLEQCFPAVITFTNTTDPSDVGPSCVWDFGDGNSSSDCGSVVHVYPNVGCYDVTLSVISPEGCPGDTTFLQYVCARPYPVADFTWAPLSPNVLNTEVNFINNSQNEVVWEWDFGPLAEPTEAFIPNPVVTFPDDDQGDYPVWLRVYNQYGCPDSIMRVVTIEGQFFIYVPNAFSPNGDGVNDLVGPMGQGILESKYTFTVFDRWGQVVFITSQPGVGWDGTLGGQPAPIGVYAWKLEVADKYKFAKREFLGHITLIR